MGFKHGIFVLWALLAIRPRVEVEQRGYMVWDKPCILHELERQEKLYMEAPMVDGKPDTKQAKLHIEDMAPMLAASGCGRIEIRKVEKK